MDDLIRIRSGDLNGRSEMPRLKHAETVDGRKLGSELGYRTDEEALYIGTDEGNKRLCGVNDLAEINSITTDILAEITNIKSRLDKLETPSE